MEKITAKEALKAMRHFEDCASFRPIIMADKELFVSGLEANAKLTDYLNQQVAIEEADAAAVPLSRR